MPTRITVTLIGVSILVALLAVWITCPILVRAQCGNIESTCYTCHQATHSVCGTTDWHTTFAHRYACWNCHGGNDTAQDKNRAHVGLITNPLENAYTSCYPCHPNDFEQRAQQLANEIGIQVSFREPAPTLNASSVAIVSQPIIVPPPTTSAANNLSDLPRASWLFPLAVLVLLGWTAWKRQTRRS